MPRPQTIKLVKLDGLHCKHTWQWSNVKLHVFMADVQKALRSLHVNPTLMARTQIYKIIRYFWLTVIHLTILDMCNPFVLIVRLLPVSFLSLLFCLPFQSFFLLIILAARRLAPHPRPISRSKFGHFQSTPLFHVPDVIPVSKAGCKS